MICRLLHLQVVQARARRDAAAVEAKELARSDLAAKRAAKVRRFTGC